MLYLSGIVLSFFLSFVLFTKRNKSDADRVLVAWLGILGFHLLTFYLLYTKQHSTYPTLIALGIPLPLAHGPFLYLYTILQTSSARLHKKHFLHFLPVILSYLMFGRFFLLPLEQKTEVFNGKGQGFETQSLINLYAIYVSGIVYTTLSLIKLLKYRVNLVHRFSNTEKINFNWLLYLITWMVVIWVVILIIQDDNLIFGAAALFVLWLGYFGIKQVQVFQQVRPGPDVATSAALKNNNTLPPIEQPEDDDEISSAPVKPDHTNHVKYQKSSLSEEDVSQIHERLKVLMAEEKPFTNPDLTLNDLAGSLGVHPNQLSQVINSQENKSFYDMVNEKRIQEFIRLVSQPGNQQYTLVSIAYDCGFNSKASFNRNFKKYTGLTPSEYAKGVAK